MIALPALWKKWDQGFKIRQSASTPRCGGLLHTTGGCEQGELGSL